MVASHLFSLTYSSVQRHDERATKTGSFGSERLEPGRNLGEASSDRPLMHSVPGRHDPSKPCGFPRSASEEECAHLDESTCHPGKRTVRRLPARIEMLRPCVIRRWAAVHRLSVPKLQRVAMGADLPGFTIQGARVVDTNEPDHSWVCESPTGRFSG